jgi:hypothetical protein
MQPYYARASPLDHLLPQLKKCVDDQNVRSFTDIWGPENDREIEAAIPNIINSIASLLQEESRSILQPGTLFHKHGTDKTRCIIVDTELVEQRRGAAFDEAGYLLLT